MFRYAFKRTSRNWKLFAAILVGVLVSSTLFAVSNVGANALLTAMWSKSLEDVPVDMTLNVYSWDGGTTMTSNGLFDVRQTIEAIPNVLRTEIFVSVRNYSWTPGEDYEEIDAVGIQANSTVYEGLTHVGGATSLGANETYIVLDSVAIDDFPVGSNYSIQVTVSFELEPPILLNVTLHVVGIVDLTAQTRNMLLQYSYYGGIYPEYRETIFIVDLENTFLPLMDYAASVPDSLGIGGVDTWIDIWVDRAAILNPYNIQGSMQALQRIENQINNALMGGGWVNDLLYWALYGFQYTTEGYRWSFLSASMPVFFVAIYLIITLNDVSFSLRRREVGLLLTKGFTRSQVTSMFVMEGVLIGLLASGLGLLLALLVVPFFLGIAGSIPVSFATFGVDTIALTFIFGVGIAVFSTYWPARKATQMPTTEALREYTLAGEPTGYRKLLSWTCLILGGYKLVVWALGINPSELMSNLIFTNPILATLIGFWAVFDIIVGFWAPLFFLWGFTMILVKGTPRFQEYAERFIHRVLGDLGGLAAHTIRRRPGRTAAVIFIAALLVGYTVQTVGVLASDQDLAVRRAFTDVGADIRVMVSTPENVTDLLPVVRAIDGVRAAAAQYSFTMYNVMGSMNARAINVTEWTSAAYFEPEWFLPEVPADRALQALADDNRTIIFERLPARQLDLDVGEDLSAQFSTGGSFWSLEVVGLFGPQPRYQSFGGFYSWWAAQPTWSYVSTELLQNVGSEVSPTGYILIALDSATSNAAVVDALNALDDVAEVKSAITVLEEYNADVLANSTVRVMQMGVLFAFILASVGVLVVVSLTLRERRQSTALMSARGTTYGQTVVMLLAESFTMMLFAILLGLIVGFIILYGLVKGGVTSFEPPLLVMRFLPTPFLGSMLLQIGGVIGLLLLATLVPILIEARSARYDLSILR